MTAGIPSSDLSIPDKVLELSHAEALEPVWRNELGGLTFRARGMDGARYIKWQPTRGLSATKLADVNLLVESEKLRWAGAYVPVPQIIESGSTDRYMWLVTQAINGVGAIDSQWKQDPETAVRAIATGLRCFHDALPLSSCPFQGSWFGGILPDDAPAQEDLVVCHGDPCVPNTLIDEHGNFAGHVDLSRLGVADRWSDLAIATYSISWAVNFDHNYDALFFETYGIEPDDSRIRFYRELWDRG